MQSRGFGGILKQGFNAPIMPLGGCFEEILRNKVFVLDLGRFLLDAEALIFFRNMKRDMFQHHLFAACLLVGLPKGIRNDQSFNVLRRLKLQTEAELARLAKHEISDYSSSCHAEVGAAWEIWVFLRGISWSCGVFLKDLNRPSGVFWECFSIREVI